jgi:preprotein translocase subunit SecY
MLQAFLNIFKIPELRNKLLFTLGALVIYRIGFWIPLPCVNQAELTAFFNQQSGTALGDITQFINIFTGGALGQSTLFGLGILPYISASIILQLLTTVWDTLKNLQKEGPAGRQKITEYTRYLTFGLCIVQSIFYLKFFQAQNLVYPNFTGTFTYWACGLMGMTTGTIFLMWLGEQIDKYGIGNGASLIITSGIIARKPAAVMWLVDNYTPSLGGEPGKIGPDKILLLIGSFLLVVAGTVLITQGQRRIPVTQAKHTRGRRVYGGQKSYLPLRVNHGGVMPIIFASSLLMFPTMLFPWINKLTGDPVTGFLSNELTMSGGYKYLYLLSYILMIYFFAFFWTSVQFQPKEMADQLRDHGSFIPGLRPGPRTADYLEKVMERITYVGAGFLAFIAVVPTIISSSIGVPFMVSSFLGGTGLLITVSVALDFIQRIEANLLMRNYKGFLGGDGPGKGPRIRGSRS